MIGTILNKRYRIESEIGQGGMGTVFHGYDSVLERTVAIKILFESGLSTEGRVQLLSEAQLVAKLNHPNIVTVYDVGEEEDTPFIVMEYVEGESLHQRRPESLEETLTIMRQVCKALEHAHTQGIVHRDLKPENVVITRDGTAKLMDFGLARSVATRYSSDGMIAGTVFYMAPEQALGQEIDPRTDLYSLGVMLYELTTGELPFMADDSIAVISQHLHAPVVPPKAKLEEIPPRLNDLILKLLNKDPQDRPASARQVLQCLESLDDLEAGTILAEELSVLDRIVRGRMVGRERELSRSRQMWQNTVSGEGQLLLISGEPGIGKTRLMREIATQAEVSGGRVLVGECPAEGCAPYAPFAQITRRALRANKDNGLEVPKQVLADLLELAPELRIDYPGVERNPRLGLEAEQMRLFENFLRFADILCQKAPLLLVMEDMHWADSGSLHMLEHLARRTRQQPVMLLGTYREVELDEALPFHETLLGLTRRRLGQRVKLERLDEEKTRDLLAVIFAEEIRDDFLEGIYQETEGNPFFVEEVCKALVESGEVWYQDGKWARAADMAEVVIPQGIRVAIQSRVSRLSEETQGVLLTAAVIGREFDYQILREVTGKDENALIDCLEEAISKQLIEETKEGGGEQLSFTHALIPATLRESISGLRRTRLHRRVATAIEELHPEIFERLAYHWGEAGDEERGLEYTIKAAERARQAYANEDAVRLYSEALALIPEDNQQRFDLLAGRAAVFGVLAEKEAQLADAEMLYELAENGGDDGQRVDALLILTKINLETDMKTARNTAMQALEIARELDDAGREGRALLCLGRLAHRILEYDEALRYINKSIMCLRKAGLNDETAESLGNLAVDLGFLGYCPAALEAAQEAVDLSKEVGNKMLEETNLRCLAIAYSFNHRYTEALQTAEVALKISREVGDLGGEMHTLNVMGINKYYLDFLEEAEADYLEGLRLAEAISNDVGIRWIAHNLVNLYDWIGAHEKALNLIDNQLEKARLNKNESLMVFLKVERVSRLYPLGKYKQSLDLAETIFPKYENLVDKVYQALLLSDMGLLCAELGRFERTHQYIEDALGRCSGIKGSYTEVDVHVICALARAVEGSFASLQVGLEWVKGAVNYAREYNLKRQLGWSLMIKANIHLSLTEFDSAHTKVALDCTEEAMNLIKIYPLYGMLPEEVLYLHTRSLMVNGREEEADEYLRQAYKRVMMVAGNFTNEDYRRSYLENVKDNRQILATYRERFGVQS